MSSSKDAALYGLQRPKRLKGDKEISSNTSASFASQLGSLINKSSSTAASSNKNTNDPSNPSSTRPPKKPRKGKEDIFATHNRNAAARAQHDLDNAASPAFAQQKHTTRGEGVDGALWMRSRRKMEEKARLYKAMRRGDVEDDGERFAVDFDRMWAERYGEDDGQEEEGFSEEEEEEEEDKETVEYVDEFGRTRQGSRAEAARAASQQRGQADMAGDRFTARPSAPSGVIYGDTIQHQAFNPDEPIAVQMEELAKKRDRSLTPPPDVHFDATREIRQKGTGFFQFSEDVGERKRQMDELERERTETERVRRARRDVRGEEKDEVVVPEQTSREAPDEQASQQAIDKRGYKRKADEFFDELAARMAGEAPPAEPMDAMQKIEAALARETE